VAPTIGLQLYTLHRLLAEPGRRGALLEEAAALGVESVEPYAAVLPNRTRAQRLDDVRALKSDIDGAGLAVSSVHNPIPGPDDADWLFEAIGELGAPIVVVPVSEGLAGFPRDAFADADTIKRYGERLSALADVAEAHGARVGYHNHEWEWAELPDGRLGYDVLWEHTDPRVVAEVDLYWAQGAGQTPADVVAKLGARVELVHVKDGHAPAERPPQQVAPGSGVVALDDALVAATAVTTHIIEADAVADDGDVMAYVRDGAAWLRGRRQRP
jgi:sugar phosphate isomerase/epimerase